MRLYKPNIKIVLADIFILLLNIVILLAFLPLTTDTPFQKYSVPGLVFTTTWILVAYFFKRYKTSSLNYFFKTIFRLLYISLTVFIIFGGFILIQPRSPYSENLLVTLIIGVFSVEYLFYFIYFSYKYATSYEKITLEQEKRENASPLPSENFDIQAITVRSEAIKQAKGDKILNYLTKHTNLFNTGTGIIVSSNDTALSSIKPYQYSTIIQLTKLNRLREINKMFCTINQKLPDNGKFICSYKTLSSTRKDIYKKHPGLKGKVIYLLHFIFHQVTPKLTLTRRFYYDITDGKRRTLSKTEVLGRLRYCGFKIIKESKIDDLNFVIVERETVPPKQIKKNYGALIKLKRVGKNGKIFNFYKHRTMHPYAEYLQDYVYEHSSLASGGKFKRDIRVTKWGHFMRKYWLDELPMLINLLKGDVKLVGVRPISKHYFSLYGEELQTERIKHKPGLLPPFYADMPKTLDDIQASELKYLYECNKKGTFLTDLKYFFLILRNIFFKKARSA